MTVDQDGEIRLLTAILNQPVPPCDSHGCEFAAKCASDKLACAAFVEYMQSGVVRRNAGIPSRARYIQLFPKEVTL